MTIDDLSAFTQAHKLIQNRHLPELTPTSSGISVAYFNALQMARRVYSDSIGEFVPLFGQHKYGLSGTYFLADGTPVYFVDLKTRKQGFGTPPSASYRIHLTTPDPEGDAI